MRRRAPPDPIRVVISDDHELVRIALRSVLTAAGMSVVSTCSNGVETVAAVARLRPDVVVMDLSMPLMDGIEATRKILAIEPDTRVVILTATRSGPSIDAAFAAGAAALAFKDDGTEAVLEAICGPAKNNDSKGDGKHT